MGLEGGSHIPHIDGNLRGIVAFEIPISRLETKAKLNQNKSQADRQGVIAALEAGGRSHDPELAATMRRIVES